ncbi:MAG: DUF2190 family protein [Xanthomonadales bacterium]|jgi:predicted RecA/RadA family phage recombinase|nr:DUF2190 family protein [Xanthomonadales bacterium]
MSTNKVEDGKVIVYANTGSAITAGSIVVMSHIIGVALVDIAATTGTGAVAIEGVFSGIPKVTAAVFVKGEKLLWDSSVSKFDDSAAVAASGDILGAVVAWEAGTSSDTTCTIKLTPGNATLTA